MAVRNCAALETGSFGEYEYAVEVDGVSVGQV